MPRYTLQFHPKALKNLHALTPEEQTRIETVLNEVVTNASPSDHEKCGVMSNNQGEKLYKVRIGDMRVICELDKPVFSVLKLAHRSKAYEDIDDVYASL